MKKLCTIILLAILSLSTKVDAQIVNIPDTNFYNALLTNGVHDSAGYITVDTAKMYKGLLNVVGHNIADLTGIEAFTAIDTLWCGNNNLTNLNVSSNSALKYLQCPNNNLTSLDLSSNVALINLWCINNKLTNLNVSSNLKYLHCQNNSLTSLVVAPNSVLTYLECYNNSLTNLDLASATTLTYLDCSYNNLVSLNFSSNVALGSLQCENNNLTNLDITFDTALTYLDCSYNSLATLDFSSNAALNTVKCHHNSLASLDVSSDTALFILYCDSNSLTSLNVSSNEILDFLDCSSNSLINLDLSSNVALVGLHCNSNSLTSLNVKNGNNHNMYRGNFNAINNPNLTCIEVDDWLYSDTNWTNIDPQAGFSTNCSKSPIVYIPDANFKAALLADTTINTNRDTAIQVSEAGTYAGEIDVEGLDISDLTGIQAFRVLTGLNCDSNSLRTLDLSSNISLSKITCSSNNLIVLNVKNGNNYNIPDSNFDATNNDSLACIQVDNAAYSTINWTHVDAGTSFGTACYLVGESEIVALADVNVYPNPVTSKFTVESIGERTMSIMIYNIMGEIVNTQNITGSETTIDMNGEASGIYYIRITGANERTINKKIVKQ